LTERLGDGEGRREARQRWRIRYSRDASAAGATQREESELWARALGGAFLTIVRSAPRSQLDHPGTDPPRLSFGPALPVGVEADEEPVEFELTDRMTIADVRTGVEAALPSGHRLVGIHDVWIGAPALPALVRELEYRFELDDTAPEPIGTAAAALLRAEHLPRERTRGSRGGTFDLRPLVVALEVVPGEPPGDRSVLRFVARVDPALGVGRPDDVLATLAELAGAPLVATRVVRSRVRLADD
jgi:radical SAM-linked protein